jgi:predicted anti-sigma-YlaC factor YlaD
MKCPDAKTLFEFSQHLMTARKEDEVRAHLAACAACRAVGEEYGQVDAALDEWKVSEPSPWFDARVRAAVASAPAARRRLWWLEHLRALALASLAMIFIGGALMVFHGRPLYRHTAPVTAATVAAQGPKAPAVTENAVPAQALSADQEVKMYKDLPVLEDYDMLADFDVLSELPPGARQVQN